MQFNFNLCILVAIELDQMFAMLSWSFNSRKCNLVRGAHSQSRNGENAVKNTMLELDLIFGHWCRLKYIWGFQRFSSFGCISFQRFNLVNSGV